MFTSHARKIKQYYRDKMKTMSHIIQNYPNKNVKCNVPETGIFTFLEVKNNISIENLIHNLESRNIFISDIRKCYLPSFNRENCLRLSTCLVDKEKMQRGIPIIFEEIDRLLNDSHQRGRSFDDL
jgi:DNA-binding transcriptional MocR family regulator